MAITPLPHSPKLYPAFRRYSNTFLRKLPRGFLLACCAALAFETANAVFDDYFYTPPFDAFRMKIKNDISLEKGNAFKVLVFGDSFGLTGAVPSVIEEQTGLSAFNFCSYGVETILAPYCMFRNYLENCAEKPAVLVIGFCPEVCAIGRDQMKVEYLYDMRRGNADVFLKELDPARAARFLVPSLKHSGFFREFLRSPRSFRMMNRRERDDFAAGVRRDRGYYDWRSGEIYGGEAEAGNYAAFSVSGLFDRYLREILSLAKKNGIRVIYMVPVTPPDWYALDVRYGTTGSYDAYLAALEKIYPELTVFKAQPLLSSKELYMDRCHLNGKGALLFSGILSAVINERKGAR